MHHSFLLKGKLADFCDVQTGPFGSQLHASDYKEHGTPIITVEHLGDNQIIHQNLPLVSERDRERLSKYSLCEGDIVFSRVGAIDRRAYVGPSENGWLFSGRLLRVRPNPSVANGRYLSYLLGHPNAIRWIFNHAVGSTMACLNTAILSGVPADLPSVSEQNRITEILDTLDDAILKTEQLVAKLRQIKQGLLHDLLTRGIDENGQLRDPIAHPEQFNGSALGFVPKDWDILRTGDILTSIDQGWSPNCDTESAPEGDWGVLKTTSVVWEGYRPEENKRLPSDLRPRPSLEICSGDVLMTRAGPNSRVGVVAYVESTRARLMLSDKLYRLIPSESVLPEFLCLALSSHKAQRHLSTLKTGLAESQTNISQAIVKSLYMQLPNVDEQQRILDEHKAHVKRIQLENLHLKKLRALKHGLMHDLLTGKVRTTKGA